MSPGGILSARSTGADRELTARLRQKLTHAAERLRGEDVAVPDPSGKLLRPLVAYAMVPPSLREELDERFWSGALAVQMVHEASLLHDDIVDEASERRGMPTVAARSGIGPALVLGDRYLTGAYRAAAATGSVEFLTRFIRAVERTVAGEVAQERAAGSRLSPATYQDVVSCKSGELFGAAAVLAGALFDLGELDERVRFGCQVGAMYQQVDDLLDFCPEAHTGKPPLQDYHQRKWTWILDLAGLDGFDLPPEDIVRTLFDRSTAALSPARQALSSLRLRRDALVADVDRLSPGDTLVAEVLESWLDLSERAVSSQEASGSAARAPERRSARRRDVKEMALALGGREQWPAYFGAHAKTFRFASRLFPAGPAARISGVYAFCRFTDDLVDEPADGASPDVLAERLEAWAELTEAAFEGRDTGVPLLDEVVREAAGEGVSWRYLQALLRGVEMDLRRARYPDWESLEEYTFGVAGAVGGWITQLFGIHDPELLERAHALGHAMQLTNIVRDVGEDWARGRLYLPGSLLEEHRLSEADLEQLAWSPGPLPDRYRAAIEAVIERADAYYETAWPGIRALPGWYRRPVAVAAEAYRGIHEEVRRNGYDNLRRRASTSSVSKLSLATKGLIRARAWA